MKNFTFADETLDLNRSQSYKLSIQLQLDGFSFSIIDTVRNKYILLKHYDLSDIPSYDQKGKKIEDILKKDKHLQYQFKKIHCLNIDPKSLIVPDALFEEKNIKKYFEFNQPMDELEEIHYKSIDQINSYNVFTIPNPISNSLKDHFNKIQYYHHSFPLIFYHLNFIHSEGIHIGLNIYPDFIDILAIHKDQLLFINSFKYQNTDDILYYVLNIYKQLNLDPSANELFITGSMSNNETVVSELKQFLKKTHYLKPPQEFTYSYLFKKDISFHFTNLFRLNLCV